MRANTKQKHKMGRRFLLAAGLIIAVVVPSAAFGGGTGRFESKCRDRGCGQIFMDVERGKGTNIRVRAVEFSGVRVNCPTSGPHTVMTWLGVPEGEIGEVITGILSRNEIAIDAKVKHRKWHFNELVPDAVARISNERIDASINFRGKFRKHNKNKAVGTLEVTLHGGATFLYPDLSGPEPIVNEWPISEERRLMPEWASFVGVEPEGCHGVQDFHQVLYLDPQDR